MAAVIIPIAVGIFISALGVLNFQGNITTIHWYHRKRVTEADKKPFGRLMGLGTLLCGLGCIVFGIFSLPALLTKLEVFTIIGAVVLVVLVAAGFALSFYAMFKYNRGIF